MKQPSVTITTLGNGLRVLHLYSPDATVGWCGVAVNAGSRDDPDDRHGLAHFVEHTIFKGTEHRRAWHILNRMERVGGELNAFTTKDTTMLYSVYPSRHLLRAAELIADMARYSTFPEAEVERERDVVAEEIASYRDTPAEAAYDDIEDIVLAGSALGHNILGDTDALTRCASSDCLAFLSRLYVPRAMVFFVMGPQHPGVVERLAERLFGSLSRERAPFVPRVAPPVNVPVHRVEDLGLHQAHTVLAARLAGRHDEARFAVMLLSNILGGPGMNSLLNVELRERRGYVYTVETSVNLFDDCGLLQVYFGCEQHHVKAATRHAMRVVSRLAEHAFSDKQLDAYKRQYCGQLVVADDNTEGRVMSAARSVLHYGSVSTAAQVTERIMSVTPEQVRHAAALLAPQSLTSLTLM